MAWINVSRGPGYAVYENSLGELRCTCPETVTGDNAGNLIFARTDCAHIQNYLVRTNKQKEDEEDWRWF